MGSIGRSRFLLGGGHMSQKTQIVLISLLIVLLQVQPALEMRNIMSSQMLKMLWHYKRLYQEEVVTVTAGTIPSCTHTQ